ncbi:hypothetical protein ACF0H5_000656 [Mactra antiquata]
MYKLIGTLCQLEKCLNITKKRTLKQKRQTTVKTIRCYECAADKDICQDEFTPSNSLIVDDCPACMKIKAKLGDNHAVQRGCSDISSNDCKDANLFGADVDVCTCSSDLCNHSNTVEMCMVNTIGMMIMAWIVKYLYG